MYTASFQEHCSRLAILMPNAFYDVDKSGFLFGGGVDFKLSRHIALRLIKADYAFSNHRYGASSVTPRTEIRGLRLQVGRNFMFGGGATPVSPIAACSQCSWQKFLPASLGPRLPVDLISISGVRSNTTGMAPRWEPLWLSHEFRSLPAIFR